MSAANGILAASRACLPAQERMTYGLAALGYGLTMLAAETADDGERAEAEDAARQFARRLNVVMTGDGRDEALAAGLRLAVDALGLTVAEAARLLGLAGAEVTR